MCVPSAHGLIPRLFAVCLLVRLSVFTVDHFSNISYFNIPIYFPCTGSGANLAIVLTTLGTPTQSTSRSFAFTYVAFLALFMGLALQMCVRSGGFNTLFIRFSIYSFAPDTRVRQLFQYPPLLEVLRVDTSSQSRARHLIALAVYVQIY